MGGAAREMLREKVNQSGGREAGAGRPWGTGGRGGGGELLQCPYSEAGTTNSTRVSAPP